MKSKNIIFFGSFIRTIFWLDDEIFLWYALEDEKSKFY